MTAVALIVTDLYHGRLGQTRSLRDEIDGQSVLAHTLQRAGRIEGIVRIVVVHLQGQDVEAALDGIDVGLPIVTHADPAGLADAHTPTRRSARKWALTAWRGGFGGATCYDELLPAGPLAEAMRAQDADAAVIVGGDWCRFDPDLASGLLERHVSAPEAMKITFTQAPPGLGAICTSRAVLEELGEHGAGFANALWYNPKKPAIDPIGKEVCLPVDPAVRDRFARFIYDTPAGQAAVRDDESAGAPAVPRHVTLELTPRREVSGPISAQHYVNLGRPDMPVGDAIEIARDVAAIGDATLMLGHLGEPTLHPGFADVIEAAHDAGCFAVGLETDLLCDEPTLDRIASLPLDVVAVRINADTSDTYKRVMAADGFGTVARNLQRLFDAKRARAASPSGRGFWIIPKLVKVTDNVHELESFFDRWVTIGGHAVIERFDTGGGTAPDLSPVPMDPPVPLPTPMDRHCAFILSDGQVTADRSDWLGRAALGSAISQPLREIWQRVDRFAEAV